MCVCVCPPWPYRASIVCLSHLFVADLRCPQISTMLLPGDDPVCVWVGVCMCVGVGLFICIYRCVRVFERVCVRAYACVCVCVHARA